MSRTTAESVESEAGHFQWIPFGSRRKRTARLDQRRWAGRVSSTMADFYQNGVVATLQKLKERPVEELERELQAPAEVGQPQGIPVKAAGPAVDAARPETEPAGAARASPVARRLAREHHLDLSAVKGTGPGGRITEKDVQQRLRQRGGQQDEGQAHQGDGDSCHR